MVDILGWQEQREGIKNAKETIFILQAWIHDASWTLPRLLTGQCSMLPAAHNSVAYRSLLDTIVFTAMDTPPMAPAIGAVPVFWTGMPLSGPAQLHCLWHPPHSPEITSLVTLLQQRTHQHHRHQPTQPLNPILRCPHYLLTGKASISRDTKYLGKLMKQWRPPF